MVGLAKARPNYLWKKVTVEHDGLYVSLLLIAILTVANGATPLYCSDVQSPADGSGHNTDPSQVTTLQYCIIDNCIIMRIDTG